ncbi:hypothetical protein MOO46_05245 [Apilactobacillus apisilvae]|uniref:Uncharacterized protein n=1 Tax=Apilactobacillus apisilvae TaxID=2923364 RepID=A0ABY4PFT0_9LACO|nr:hypothetical protein [Apilactobacillus apisilvae]UQS84656.1 hypothetical protein MOO46_05245 [Apilactobacillus apisilvae]
MNLDDASKDQILEIVNQYKRYYYIKMDMLQQIRQLQQQANVSLHTELHNDSQNFQDDLNNSININLSGDKNNIEKNIINEFTQNIADDAFKIIMKDESSKSASELAKYIHGEDIFLGFSNIGSIFKDINRWMKN